MRAWHNSGGMLAIALIAGSALGGGAAAQQPDRTDRDAKQTPDRMADSGSIVFVSGKKALGMDVKNAEDKTLGTVDDMIIDRGSGRVRYIVLKSGAVMGLGGKLVTVPYSSFGWDSADKHVTLAATPEEIKTWTEFDKKSWAEGTERDDGYVRRISKDYYDPTTSPWPTTAKADKADVVKGTVRGITRHSLDNGREEMIVVVADPSGNDREVVLGPSWYAAGNNSIALYRGAPIEVDVFTVDRQGRQVAMAHTARVQGKGLSIYDTGGNPLWLPSTSVKDRNAWSAAPFVLATEIKGKKVDCRGQECGKVRDVVMECTSGRVTFLVVDPDKAFLGVGDENRLVPWSIMTTSLDGKVHLDADKTMITNASKVPDDLKTLSTGNEYKRIYGTYDVAPPNFGKPRW